MIAIWFDWIEPWRQRTPSSKVVMKREPKLRVQASGAVYVDVEVWVIQ